VVIYAFCLASTFVTVDTVAALTPQRFIHANVANNNKEMKRVSIITVIFMFNLITYGQVRGKYCCDNNWTRIDFKTSDSLNIMKPFYYGSHFPGYGEGIYKIKHDSLFIEYIHKPKSNYKPISTEITKTDSINLCFRRDLPTVIKYMNQKDTIRYDSEPKLQIKRMNDSLYIESIFTSIVIPAKVLTQKNISSLVIYLDNSLLIKEKSDTFKLDIINDSEIILNQQSLKKCNCDKKSKPIY